jgi:hypothetical protein
MPITLLILAKAPPQDFAQEVSRQLCAQLNLAWLLVLCKMIAAKLLDHRNR